VVSVEGDELDVVRSERLREVDVAIFD